LLLDVDNSGQSIHCRTLIIILILCSIDDNSSIILFLFDWLNIVLIINFLTALWLLEIKNVLNWICTPQIDSLLFSLTSNDIIEAIVT